MFTQNSQATASPLEVDPAWSQADSVQIIGNYQFRQHLMDQFKLETKEELDYILDLKITPASSYIDSETKRVTNFYRDISRNIIYNTVASPSTCNSSFFANSKYHHMRIKTFKDEFFLYLTASDYGRYHCFKVPITIRTKLNQKRFNPRQPRFIYSKAYKIFVSHKPISLRGLGDIPDSLDGLQKTIVKDTYYSFRGLGHVNRKDLHYLEINQNFNLYTRRESKQLEFHLTVPDKTRSIRNWQATLTLEDGCNRRVFYSEGLSLNLFLNKQFTRQTVSINQIPNKPQYYLCIKIEIDFDRHYPYRFFLVPLLDNSK